jgi:CTP:molybdopterin cytidylyltransferase MocA
MNSIFSRSPGFGVVILAAGASRRMGRPKALLPWRGSTILGHLAVTWRASGAGRIAVVYDPGNQPLMAEMDRLSITDRIANPRPEQGMMSSAIAASRSDWCADLARVAVALVDQPQIPAEWIVRLAAFASENPSSICQPEHAGKRGHPVFFPLQRFRELADSRAESLRDFIHLQPQARRFLSCDSPAVLADLNTPEDYERACGDEAARDQEERFH